MVNQILFTGINDRIIIEIKTTWSRNIPLGGWYNLQCQLWSYSQIDEFKDSKNIFLIGDIRIKTKKTFKTLIEKTGYPDYNEIYEEIPYCSIDTFRNNPRWIIYKEGKLNLGDSQVRKFHEQCKLIFEIYGGKYHGKG